MRKSGLLVLILSAKLFAQVNAYPPTASAVPSGAAGGDLAGTYPNPTIDLTLAKAWTAIHIFRANAIAATPTERIRLQNQTAATAGVPSQWSPCIYWEGQGWKTDATAASQKVEFRQCLVPVQGAADPQARMDFGYAINGGAFVTVTSFLNANFGVGTFNPNTILSLLSSGVLSWEASAGVADFGFSRTSAGRIQGNSGTAGKWGALDIGTISMQSLAVPGAPIVTPTCVSACTQTWTYGIVAKLADGTTTEIGTTGSTAAQNATLDGTNFNVLTWSAVTGATSYDVRRTVSGGTPATLGLIATVTTVTFTDDGDVGNGTASPTVNATGSLLFAIDNRANIGKPGANRPSNIYSVSSTVGVANISNLSIGSAAPGSNPGMYGAGSDSLVIHNSVFNGFGRIAFGDEASTTLPALKVSGAGLSVRLANDSAGSTMEASKYLTTTNCSSSVAPAVCASASAGSVVVAAGATTVTVNTTAVTANSQIFIQEDSSLNTKLTVTCNTTIARTYAVTARTAATSFVIETSAASVTNPACLSYQIVN